MLSVEQKARVKWACRRGMLELDVIIMPFFEAQFEALSAQQQQDFIALLEYDDPILFSWFMNNSRCDNAAIAAMVDTIATYNRAQLV